MKHSISKATKYTLVALFWLTIWQIVSLCTPEMLFSSPLKTAAALLHLVQQLTFWLAIGRTLFMTVCGFLLAFAAACLLGTISHCSASVRALLAPAVHIMKSVPVACFVVVALIFMSSQYLSVLVSFFVVFPVTYVGLQTGLIQMSRPLAEMVGVFRVPLGKRLRLLYLPQLLPTVLGSCRVSVGMCWKAGIAGEIIGLPLHSIGEQLYLAKLYYATDELFAWTIVIICISLLFEKLLVGGLMRLQKRVEGGYGHST